MVSLTWGQQQEALEKFPPEAQEERAAIEFGMELSANETVAIVDKAFRPLSVASVAVTVSVSDYLLVDISPLFWHKRQEETGDWKARQESSDTWLKHQESSESWKKQQNG